ncbi:amidohydrolase [Brevibacterium daeguense]|uniref:Amidohydrolase n=1 Tax=Brevibacterium daeguense TaxID=909936 RepID=A0ABP8EGL8_9MICO|nr:amidohydrolase [Brevibacterium daeguense]
MYQPVPVRFGTTVAITGGTVLPIASGARRAEPILDGTVLVEDGRITAVGPAAEVPLPDDIRIVDAAGSFVSPGLVESHAHLGIHEDGEAQIANDTNEATDPNGAALRAIDGINPADIGFRDALRGGVTSAVVKPGSANPIGGRSAAVKTWGRVVDEMLISENVSVKAALGENPKEAHGRLNRLPSVRTGVAKVIRDAFVAARNYAAHKADARELGVLHDEDLTMETLSQVLQGGLLFDQHCHRADDIATAIRLSEEFGYRLVINHGTEAHLIADYIADKRVDVIVGPILTSRSKVELRHRTVSTPAVLVAAGVRIALTTDHPVVPIELLRDEAALSIRAGLDPAVALDAITINPARIMGLDDRLGSLEPGKDGDVVIWSAHPLDVEARAVQVFVDGREVYTHDWDAGEGRVADPFGTTFVHLP